ncbi:hypothetical protein L226DRAFT_328741 [Lentinus tigrinus ALCF2SS1-7]|uniref:BTB domain-containing protein n=1 Tax=Lentinus tigrinus ALCF2SS1-6 TaxID=1328759 RepID=A0A5C2SFL1_9APHY|nr:hypothetical protein L227DRAFT_599438 [Lentinus tigrinus ALCF2SS1-6]RPD77668.1 hypothetical protein L226DRAFT_328741 [Lentinus tigrinus ALCF2SS1-7]
MSPTTTDEEHPGPGTLVKDQELWLEDGNIVIVANGSHAFRVLKSLLSRVSPVLKDIFEKEKCKPDRIVEGCPSIPFYDSPTDVRHFLRTVILGGPGSLRQASLPFATLASIIRIAHKYEATALLKDASSRLESFLIPRPGHWLEQAALPWEARWDMGQQQCGISFEPSDAVSAVNLALPSMLDMPLMLPLAFYLCSLADNALILRHGVEREDEPDVRDVLGDADYTRCFLAIPKLSQQCHASVGRILYAAMSEAFAGCRLNRTCKDRLREMFVYHARDEGPCLVHDLFVRLDRRTSPPAAFVQYKDTLCQPCLDRLLALSEEECAKMRQKLPEFFHLDVEGWQS